MFLESLNIPLNPKHQTTISNAIQEVVEIFGQHILKSLRNKNVTNKVSSVKPIGLGPAYSLPVNQAYYQQKL